MEKGRWWKHSKVWKGEDGGRTARYVKEYMVEELQGMEEGWARN